jgi:hypothetical protein
MDRAAGRKGRARAAPAFVMPGFMPGIHAFLSSQGVDGRDKPSHDVERRTDYHPMFLMLAPFSQLAPSA